MAGMHNIFFRWSSRTGLLRRPSWYSDMACAGNALRYLGGDENSLTLIADTPIPNRLASQGWTAVLEIAASTNSEAFLSSLDLALSRCDEHDAVYFVEQDYLHTPDAKDVLEDGLVLNPEGYVTLFDDPLYYWQPADVASISPATSLYAGLRRHWRTALATTMTFAAPAWVLLEDRDIFQKALVDTVRPPDRSLWAELTSAGRVLVASVPGAASHIETTSLAPFVDWRHLSEIEIDSTGLPSPTAWIDILRSVSAIAVGDGVSAEARERVLELGIHMEPLDRSRLGVLREPMWALVTAEEKGVLDASIRDASTPIVGVIVCASASEYAGRWFSGRDWLLEDLIEAHQHERIEGQEPEI